MSFKAAKASIMSKEGVSANSAGAILGAGAQKASPKARKKNPKINKVLAAQHGGATKGSFTSETPRSRDKGSY